MARKETLLELSALSMRGRQQIIYQDISFRLRRGELVVLLGNSASGKTQLLRSLLGLSRPSSGEIRLFGSSRPGPELRRRLGLVLDQDAFFPQLTARQNLRYYSLHRGLVDDKTVLEKACERVNFQAYDTLYLYLSSFQRRRLALALALLDEPDLLLLDEPFLGFSQEEQRELLELLGQLAHQEKKGLLFTSSFFPRELQLCDYYALMAGGRMLSYLSFEELQRRSGNCLCVTVDRPEACLNFLEQHYAFEDLEVESGMSLRIYDRRYESWELNQLLVQEGFHVHSLHTETESLEAYYQRLIKGKGA